MIKEKTLACPITRAAASSARLQSLLFLRDPSFRRRQRNGVIQRGTRPDKPSEVKDLPLTVGSEPVTQPHRASVSSSLRWGRSCLSHGHLMKTHLLVLVSIPSALSVLSQYKSLTSLEKTTSGHSGIHRILLFIYLFLLQFL